MKLQWALYEAAYFLVRCGGEEGAGDVANGGGY